MARIAGAFDRDRAFVDDDDEDDLRRVRDRSKALEHLDAIESLRRAKALGDGRHRVGQNRGADCDAGEPPDLVVARGDVAVDADVGDDVVRRVLDRQIRAGSGKRQHQGDERREHVQRMRTLVRTSACR